MRIPEAAREAVLARVTAELANAAGKSPHNHTKPAANAAVRRQGNTPGSQRVQGENESAGRWDAPRRLPVLTQAPQAHNRRRCVIQR
jgi:hypothetical protein